MIHNGFAQNTIERREKKVSHKPHRNEQEKIGIRCLRWGVFSSIPNIKTVGWLVHLIVYQDSDKLCFAQSNHALGHNQLYKSQIMSFVLKERWEKERFFFHLSHSEFWVTLCGIGPRQAQVHII